MAMNLDEWATVADLGTALGTLVLAVATFSAVRSGNRTARAAERSLLTSLVPLLVPSRLEDAPLKVNFGDSKWFLVPGSTGAAEVGGGDGSQGPAGGVVYLTVSLRNVGNGISVLRGWHLNTERPGNDRHPPLDSFRLQTRDLYIAAGDTGFWQGAFRDPAEPQYAAARKAIENRTEWWVDLLYTDHEGGQPVISRLRLQPRPPRDDTGDRNNLWTASVTRHWNVNRPNPR